VGSRLRFFAGDLVELPERDGQVLHAAFAEHPTNAVRCRRRSVDDLGVIDVWDSEGHGLEAGGHQRPWGRRPGT